MAEKDRVRAAPRSPSIPSLEEQIRQISTAEVEPASVLSLEEQIQQLVTSQVKIHEVINEMGNAIQVCLTGSDSQKQRVDRLEKVLLGLVDVVGQMGGVVQEMATLRRM